MRISVVIPTLNEAASVASTILRVRELGDCEVVVVDGGSEDGTVECASEADRILTCRSGRAAQQNKGAAEAAGDVLLFLHADCWPASGGFEAIRSTLEDAECVGGCFQQAIEADGWGYRLLERGNAWRVRLCKWAYGDQGIFVRRDSFERVGGFPDLRLMEDLFFMKRLKREGRFQLLEEPRLHISARRWQRVGVTRQTLRNWALIGLAQCGVSPNRLARFYPHVR